VVQQLVRQLLRQIGPGRKQMGQRTAPLAALFMGCQELQTMFLCQLLQVGLLGNGVHLRQGLPGRHWPARGMGLRLQLGFGGLHLQQLLLQLTVQLLLFGLDFS
jgi:hypothetical protein